MKYFISPDQEPSNKLAEENIFDIISRNFKNVEIHKIDNSERAYIYEIIYKNEKEFVDILIPKTKDSLVFSTNILQKLSNFINEIRKEFPTEENVLLYDESYTLFFHYPKRELILVNCNHIINNF